ncbi:hypothetical protein CDAR_544501, partial [Caerostris darwini]
EKEVKEGLVTTGVDDIHRYLGGSKNSKMNEPNQVAEEMSFRDEICSFELLAFSYRLEKAICQTACHSFLVPGSPSLSFFQPLSLIPGRLVRIICCEHGGYPSSVSLQRVAISKPAINFRVHRLLQVMTGEGERLFSAKLQKEGNEEQSFKREISGTGCEWAMPSRSPEICNIHRSL